MLENITVYLKTVVYKINETWLQVLEGFKGLFNKIRVT